MGHQHAGSGAKHRGRLKIVFGLTTIYLVAEVVGALWTNSLALLADAAHMLTDVAGLGLALFAIWFAARPAHPRKSFGYYRIEILAALLNGSVLLAVSGYILYEAWGRFTEPPAVSGGAMMVVAAIGLVVNIISALLLRNGSEESLNVQGAFLEVVADLLGSLGVVVAGGIILLTGWNYADPIFSVAIGLFVIPRTVRLMMKSINILMEGMPEGMKADDVERAMLEVRGVSSVHDMHIWAITSGLLSMSAHVLIEDGIDSDAAIETIGARLEDQFHISHCTIQAEHRLRDEDLYHQVERTT